MAVDLTEEHSASNMTSERLEAETSERFKLEKELQEQQSKIKYLQDASEKLEMELICAKSDLNGFVVTINCLVKLFFIHLFFVFVTVYQMMKMVKMMKMLEYINLNTKELLEN